MDIKKQITLNTVGASLSLFSQWLISVALVRMGGFEDAGIFSLVMSIANVFGAVANYSIRQYQVSDAGHRFTQRQYLWARICTIGASFLLCGLYLAADAGYTSVSRWGIVIYLVYTDLNFFSDIMFGTLQLKDKLYLNGYSNIQKSAYCLAAFMASYAIRKDLLLSLLCMTLANAATVVLYDLRHYVREEEHPFRAQGDGAAVRGILRLCFPLMVSTMLPLVTTAAPRRSIEALLGDKQLGYFSSLFTPTVIITTLVPTVILGFVPAIAKCWEDREKGAFMRQVVGCFVGILAFTLLALLCALIAGRPVMKLLFGSEILQYFDLLYLAIVVSGLSALRGCGGSILICMRRTGTVTAASAAELAIALALSHALIAKSGIRGAAVALLAAYGVGMAIEAADIARCTGKHFSGGKAEEYGK